MIAKVPTLYLSSQKLEGISSSAHPFPFPEWATQKDSAPLPRETMKDRREQAPLP